jgi:hypothetical protein
MLISLYYEKLMKDYELYQCILEITFTFPLHFCVVWEGAKTTSCGLHYERAL